MMIYMKLLLAAALWGGSFVAGKIITGELGAYSAAFIRFAMASVVLVGLTISKEGRLPRLKGWPIIGMTVLGMTGVFSYNVCFFKGLQTIEASRASIIIANNPVFIALLSCVFFREQLG
ncbi:MAG: DMT family transporter, partial [Anaerohalosphaera sp.]|nr:DMT family transporter [Anaerohalosphaera sp.]